MQRGPFIKHFLLIKLGTLVFFKFQCVLQDLGVTPWGKLLTSWPVWALIIAETGHDWGLYTMVTDLPKYMSDVMHFDIAQVFAYH